MDETTKKEDSKKEEVDIHCACAMGDLSEFAPVETAKKVVTKKAKKELKNDLEKENLDNNK